MRRRIGMFLGPALLLVTLAVPAPDGLGPAAWRVVGLAAWMATWWIAEVVPLGVTGLLPIALVPMLGAGTAAEAASPFASTVIFLFLGGFLLAAAVQRWRLHERIAYLTALRVGTRPGHVVLGFMAATAFLSMWMSNTASVLLMLPMAVSIVALVPEDDPRRQRFGLLLVLGIAYAASIGGLGTLIGTPPNAFLAAYAQDELGRSIGFAQWMAWSTPLVVVGLVLSWLLLTRVLLRMPQDPIGGRVLVRGLLDRLGPVATPERRVLGIWGCVAAGWLLRPLLPDAAWIPGDPAIAVIGAIVMFVVPSGAGGRLLEWDDAQRVPWGALLLFGGGLSLAAAMDRTGVAAYAGEAIAARADLALPVLVLLVVLVSLVATEFLSNTASAALLLPVLAAVADGAGIEPMVLLVPATLMASCGFMMPAGTPPNTLAIGSGLVRVREMVRHGVWLNLLFVALVTAHGLVLARLVNWT